MPTELPLELIASLRQARAIAVSGSRTADEVDGATLQLVMRELRQLPPSVPVMVGDASGVDSVVRQHLPRTKYFQRTANSTPAIVARSVRLARAVAAEQGVLFAFPSYACPPKVWPTALPNQAFNGSGNGTWATAALAVGLRATLWLLLPYGAETPPWHGIGAERIGDWLYIPGGA